jgi:hypothetical protein
MWHKPTEDLGGNLAFAVDNEDDHDAPAYERRTSRALSFSGDQP